MGLVYVLLLCVLIKTSSQKPAQGLEQPMFVELDDGESTHLVHTSGSPSIRRLKNANSDNQRLYLPNNNLLNTNSQESLNFDQTSRTNNLLNTNSQDNLDFNQKIRSNNLLNMNSQDSLNFNQTSRTNNLLNANTQDTLTFNQKSRSSNLLDSNAKNYLNLDQMSRTNNLLNANTQDNINFNQNSRNNNLLNLNEQSSLSLSQLGSDNNLMNENSQHNINFDQSKYGFSRPSYYNRNYYKALQNYMTRLSQYPMWSRRSNNLQGNHELSQSASNSALFNLLDMQSLNKAKTRFSHLSTDTGAEVGQTTLESNDGFLGNDRLAPTDTSRLSQLSQAITSSPVLTNSARVGGNLNALDNAAQRRFDALNEASAKFAQLLQQANSDTLNTGTTTLSVQALKDEAKRRSDTLDEITARFNNLQYQASSGLANADEARRIMYKAANLNALTAQSSNDNTNTFNDDLSGRISQSTNLNQNNQAALGCGGSNAQGNFAKRQQETGRRMFPDFHNMDKRSVRGPGFDRNEYELSKHL